MNTFILNGNAIVAKEFDFNAFVKFDDYGIPIQDVAEKPLSFVRAYVAHCMDVSLEEAGQVINDHVVAGGKLDEIFEVINKKLEGSGFFRALSNESPEVPKKASAGTRKTK